MNSASVDSLSDSLESRLRLEHLFEAAPDPIFVVDADGVIIDVNSQAARSFAYSVGEMLGRSIDMLVPDASRRPMGLSLDLEARRRDGSTFPVDITLGPFMTPGGRYVAAIVRDVTERRQAAEELARRAQGLTHMNAELEAFAYSVSHDLRTPLRAIQGLGIALEEDFGPDLPRRSRDYLERIVAAAKRMDNLILDLLAYSRVGRGQSVHQAVDLDSVWRAVHEDLTPPQKTALTIRSPLGRVWGNLSMMAQVATNLVANALKFTAPGEAPQIEVTSRIAHRRVRVDVTDNGIGIEPEHHVRIFGIFERLHGDEQYPGTGIGLALVKKAVEGMNGVVGVESRLGQGSCFWFELEQAEGA